MDDDTTQSTPVFRQLTMEQLCRGARFSGDIEQDFELDDLYFTDEESDDETWKLGPEHEGNKKRVNLHTPPLIEGLAKMCENVTQDGGVRKLTLANGTGIMPPKGSKIRFHYVGFIGETSEKFDASTQRGGLHAIVDDENCGLLPGLRLAIKAMQLHEVAQVLLEPNYAFGPVGCPPRIPPGCHIIFNVRIVDAILPQQLDDPIFMSRDELRKLDFRQVYDASRRLRNDATDHYKRNNYSKAVRGYRQAIDMIEDFWKVNDEQHLERAEHLACCFCNLAQSYLRLNKGPQACNACKNGLRQPSTKYKAKLFFRFAKAKLLVDSFAEARTFLKKAEGLGAEKADCKKLEQEISEKEAYQNDVEKEMASLMFKEK